MPKAKVKIIKLEPSKHHEKWWARGSSEQTAWTSAPPFCVNPRGKLAHRVRHVTDYYHGKRLSHHHVDYLCGNGCNVKAGKTNDVLTSDPDRLLCTNCEKRAVLLKLPTGDELAGRHVHQGVLVPQQICHLEEE